MSQKIAIKLYRRKKGERTLDEVFFRHLENEISSGTTFEGRATRFTVLPNLLQLGKVGNTDLMVIMIISTSHSLNGVGHKLQKSGCILIWFNCGNSLGIFGSIFNTFGNFGSLFFDAILG